MDTGMESGFDEVMEDPTKEIDYDELLREKLRGKDYQQAEREAVAKRIERETKEKEGSWNKISLEQAKKIAASHPYEAICARFGRDGHDAAIYKALTQFKLSDLMKKEIGRMILQFPYGVDMQTFDEEAFDALVSVNPIVWKGIADYTDRSQIAVDLFNIKRMFEEKFIWEVMPFDPQYVHTGMMDLKTSYGAAKIAITSLKDMFSGLRAVVEKGEIRKQDDRDQIVFLDFKEAAYAMTLFIIGTCAFKVGPEGKYRIPKQPYHGNINLPEKWIRLAQDLIRELADRTPRFFDQGQNVASSLYADIFEVLPKDMDILYAEYLKALEQVKIVLKVNPDDIAKKAAKFVENNRSPGAFLDLKSTQQKAFNDDELFTKDRKKYYMGRNMGFEYAPAGKTTQGAFDVFYYANVARYAYGKKKTWFEDPSGRLLVFGDTIGNRGPVLENICTKLKGPVLVLDYKSTVKVTGWVQKVKLENVFDKYVTIRPTGEKNVSIEEEGALDIYFFEGYGIIGSVDQSVPRLGEKDVSDDTRILEVMRRFSKSYACKAGHILLCVHNLMHPTKFKEEVKYIQSLGLRAGMIPFPSGDSDSFAWVVYAPRADRANANAEKIYDYRLFENTAMLKIYKAATDLGMPTSNTSKFGVKTIAQQCMRMIHFYKWEKKVARKGYVSAFTPDKPVDVAQGWNQTEGKDGFEAFEEEEAASKMAVEKSGPEKRKADDANRNVGVSENSIASKARRKSGQIAFISGMPDEDIQESLKREGMIGDFQKYLMDNKVQETKQVMEWIIALEIMELETVHATVKSAQNQMGTLYNLWNTAVAKQLAAEK